MKIIRWLLFPLSQLYVLVTAIRNFMFDVGFLEQAEFPIKVISVGNLSTGGTGKTPFIEYLIKLLMQDKKVAVLSRGYGRQTSGFMIANEQSTASTIGDEPFQIFRKYGQQVVVAVAEKRKIGIKGLLETYPELEVVLLDDAYQHRWVKRDLNILLTTYSRPFFKDLCLPTGNLRETRFEAKRADLVVVTKCKAPFEALKNTYDEKINSLAGDVDIYYSSIRSSAPVAAFTASHIDSGKVILLSGIAKPDSFEAEIAKSFEIVDHFQFKDHHRYGLHDLDDLNVKLSENSYAIITTEKDMVRLLAYQDHTLFEKHELFYLPIETQVQDELLLRQRVMNLFQ